ncbi:EAL and GGDEF domain-containing protein [Nakamurella deserti]|uniref:sensor domain-containing protein n=1 Tax=Nakamurella deserti TaxID=2164074 RepID=UPI000DBE6BFB|nr:PAS domain S-box protein [Nakamurella deserti]
MSGANGPAGPADLPPDLMARALDSVAEAVVITDHLERVIYWNAAAESLYGYTAAEALGSRISELVVPEPARQRGFAVFDDVAAGEVFRGEWLMRDKNGREFPVLASTSPILDANGRPRHFIGVSRDVSSEKEAYRTAQTLAGVVANSNDGILTCDVDGVITWANDRVAAIYGWPSDELVGQPLSVLVEATDGPRRDGVLARVLTGETLAPMVERRRRRDGAPVEVSLALAVVRDEDGEVCGASAVIRDLTVENALRRDLERQAEDMRARFEQSATPQTLMNMAGEFEAVNDAFCALLGHTRDELLRMNRLSVAHVSDSGAGTAHVELLQSGRQRAASFEKMLRHRDGYAIPVLVDVTVLHDDRGIPYGMASFLRDLRRVSSAEQQLDRQRALFAALNQRASDVALVADADMTLRYVTSSATDVFGYTADEVLGRTTYSFVHPDDLPALRDTVARVLADREGFERITLRVVDRSGAWRWVEESMTNALAEPEIRGVVLNVREVTAEVQAKDELRRSEARYRAIAETAQEGIIVFTPAGEVIFLNQKLADLLGHGIEDLIGVDRVPMFDPDTENLLREKLSRRVETGPETYEVPYRHPDGSWHTLSMSVAPLPLPDTDELGSLAMVSDVTEARRAENELRHRSAHDVLTDLPNRALLVDRIQRALARRRPATDGSIALLFLDLDHFKLVNDSRGHDAGDLLLIEIGHRLRHAVRPQDTVARLGGDEFAVLCENVDEALAMNIADRLRDALSRPVELGGPRVYVDASIGIALSPPHDADTLLRFADVAMYEAKASGRGRIRVFDATLAQSGERRLLVMNALREALDGDRLTLHYQPIVDIAGGRMTGVEALLRWQDDDLGRVSPLEVVDAADAMGLSLALDRWVIQRASREMVELRRRHGLERFQLSVNVSARSFAAPGLEGIVARSAVETGWASTDLTLEVTESAIMTDAPGAVALLTELKGQGVRIAVDDFGTGYSSLAYLKRLPVSTLKIDRSFIDQVTTDADSRAIVRSIVQLADALGLDTVAEGIETAENAAVMLELGCSVGQGWLWSAAVPADELSRVAARWAHRVPAR